MLRKSTAQRDLGRARRRLGESAGVGGGVDLGSGRAQVGVSWDCTCVSVAQVEPAGLGDAAVTNGAATERGFIKRTARVPRAGS